MRKILKEALILLIAAVLFFSTVAVTADTIQEQPREISKSKPLPVIKQDNSIPIGAVDILSEGFEGGTVPPPGWELWQTNPNKTWEIYPNPHSGNYNAICFPDSGSQNEGLVTPSLDFTGYSEIKLSFWWYMSYYFGVDPYDYYDLTVWITTDGISWIDIWCEDTIGPFNDWEYYDTTFGIHIDLSAYIGETNVRIAFYNSGFNGGEMGLDDILIYGEEVQNTPNAPTIDGPINGKVGTSYPYTFTSIDPDGDDVSYYIEWGDGYTTPWTEFRPSGVGYSESHSWDTQGNFVIQAKAKDIYGAESEWTTLTVTIPRDKVVNRPLLQFLQCHPNLFLILQKLIQQLGFGL